MLLIGSRALALRAPHLLTRPPCDFDWVCTKAEFDLWMEKDSHKVNPTKVYELPEHNKWIVEGSTNCEFEIITPGTSSELLADLVYNDKKSLETPFGLVPSLSILFAIKDSHKYKKFNNSSAGFWKTAIDWHMLKQSGCAILPEQEAFHKLREQESYAAQKHPKLNVNKDNFFDEKNGIHQVFEHDDLHKVVAINAKPAYEYYLKDNSEVMCSKEKFFECSEFIRMCGVCEEAMVLGLERSLIPFDIWTPEIAWRFALAKIATSITSGYFREYIFQNIFKALEMYSKYCSNYYEKFKGGVIAGTVRYINNNEKDLANQRKI